MERLTSGSSAKFWFGLLGVVAAWWTLDGVTDVMNYRMMAPNATGMERIWRAYMWSAWLWIPLTMQALWLADRFPLSRDGWPARLGLHLAGAATACVARAGVVALLNESAGWYRVLPSVSEILVTSLANNFFLYWMLVGVGHALVYARRVRERDEQLARAELNALKMQLQPHFLFNTLNTINTYVRADPPVAQRMISRLSDLLRRVLESDRVQEVAVQEELRFVGAYLDIEQVRFDERLNVAWSIDPGVLRASVPHLILQPLVENAIRHGIAPRSAPGTVQISARRDGDALELAIRDNGVGNATPEQAQNGRSGRGLTLTRNRLKQLYGDRSTFVVNAPASGGFEVTLTLPFHERIEAIER